MKERKRLRLKDYDYSSHGAYFVTICSRNKGDIFGKLIERGKVVLNELGIIVKHQWEWLEKHFSYVSLDEYIIMPDHFHGILVLNSLDSSIQGEDDVQHNRVVHFVGNGRDQNVQCSRDCIVQKPVKIKPVYDLIGAFKTTSSKLIHRSGYDDFKWKKSFYDRIIRNEYEFYNIRSYIRFNAYKSTRTVQSRTTRTVQSRLNCTCTCV